MKTGAIFLLAIAALAVNFLSASEILEERKEDESERIIGGTSAKAGQFPWAAALYFNGRFICTASIISDLAVLTAAHCVTDNNTPQSASSFYAIANYKRSAPSLRIDFASLTVHPDYNRNTIDNDLAVFRATASIATTEEVKKVCLAGPDTQPMQYKNATAMGWGNTNPIRFLPPNIPEELQHVEQKIIENSQCSIPLLGAPSVTKEKICATGLFNGVCNGDSGGPLVHLSADKVPVQLGVTSYGNALFGCGKISPAVWARVSAYHAWILANIADPQNTCTV